MLYVIALNLATNLYLHKTEPRSNREQVEQGTGYVFHQVTKPKFTNPKQHDRQRQVMGTSL